MSIAKPFVFAANTYAKSTEVNANFDTVYGQVNTNISNIAKNATDIDNLENNKANINGNSTQRFAVANPTTDNDAINRAYLMSAIGNSIDYINGLIITKDSGSPEDTIIVSEGSCYDSTKTTLLTLANSTSKQNENQGANTTYYVYIIGNADATSIDILISNSGVSPSLPSGYTLYRLIGSYTTNGDGNILNIYGVADYRFDGQWVGTSEIALSTSSSVGTYDLDLSSYLPNDIYAYEILVSAGMYTDGINKAQSLSSSIITIPFRINHTESYADGSASSAIIPIGADRILKYGITGNSGGSCALYLYGYKRLGNNG